MAPPKTYRSPHEQLMDLLAEAREEGLSFVEAWDRAMRPGHRIVLSTTLDAPVGAVRWPTDSAERLAWRHALIELRDEIRRAYERRPATRREACVTVLLRVLDQAPSGFHLDAGVRFAA